MSPFYYERSPSHKFILSASGIPFADSLHPNASVSDNILSVMKAYHLSLDRSRAETHTLRSAEPVYKPELYP